MPADRRAPRRRRGRPVRVVRLRSTGRPPIAEEEAGAWRVGLEGLRLLAACFPDFVRDHVAGRQVTPPGLLGCVAAFFQLVEAAGCPLRPVGDMAYGGELEHGDTPADTVAMFDDVSPEYMGDLSYWLWTPRPCYYGLGVESMLDEGGVPPSALTVLLWQIYSRTRLGLGVDLMTYAEHLDEEVLLEISRIKPLPADAPIHTLPAHLAVPEAALARRAPDDDATTHATAQLIAYAFGKTDNDLANHSDYDVEGIHTGETDDQWDWSQLADLVEASQEARALEQAYGAWSARVGQDPAAIRDLGIAIHKAARLAERELQESAKPLMTLLGTAEALRTAEGVLAL